MSNVSKLTIFVLFIGHYLYISGDTVSSAYQELLVAQHTAVIQLQFPYNVNTDYVTNTETNGGTVTSTTNFATLKTNTTANGAATMESKHRLRYHPGQGHTCAFSAIFDTGVANNEQIIGIGNSQDGFFFGFNGTAFGVLHRVNSVDTWIAQTSWNGDKVDGTGASGVTLTVTMGNTYKIQYKGDFGTIKFYVEKPTDGSWILVHTIQHANANTTTTLLDPHLPLRASVENSSGSTTDVTVKVSAIAGFVEGKVNTDMSTRYSQSNLAAVKSIDDDVVTNVLTIQNKSTYQSKTNNIMMHLDQLSIMLDGSKDSRFILHLNPTIAGSPSFTDVSTTTSIVSYDTAGTTVSGGKELATFYLQSSSDQIPKHISLKDYNIVLFPGDQLVISGQLIGSGSKDVYVSISWIEEH